MEPPNGPLEGSNQMVGEVRQKVATVPCVEWVGHFKGMQLEKVLP